MQLSEDIGGMSPLQKKILKSRLAFKERSSALRTTLLEVEKNYKIANLRLLKIASRQLQKALSNLAVSERNLEVTTLSLIKSYQLELGQEKNVEEIIMLISKQITAFEVTSSQINLSGEDLILTKFNIASNEIDKASKGMLLSVGVSFEKH